MDIIGLTFMLIYSTFKAATARGYVVDWARTRAFREEFADIPVMARMVARIPSRRRTISIAIWWSFIALVCARGLVAACVQL